MWEVVKSPSREGLITKLWRLERNYQSCTIKEKLEKTFSPKRVDLISSNIMGHEIINVLPVYKDETINSERKKLSTEELEKIKEKIDKIKIEEGNKLEEKEKNKEEGKTEEISEKNTWLPKRIP